jgi:signal transduction histidine kinase
MLSRKGDCRRLVIQDNGQGFDVGQAVADNLGYGLVSMRDRARNLPGTFDVDGQNPSGTLVTVTW